jgi:AraC family transcriptional regulator
VDVIPRDTPAYWRMDAASEHLCMLLEDRFIMRVAIEAGADPDRIEVVPCFNAPDLQIEGLGLSMLSEMKSGGLGGELYAESLANVLALHLLREHSSLGRGSRRRIEHESERGKGLSRRSLALATDYINDNLPGKLTLEEIAGSANMSPYHFARAFKINTGLSPHRYVVQKRVERARSLLAETNLTTSEIASAVGFSSRSHLAFHFRRLLGVSPSALRQESTL